MTILDKQKYLFQRDEEGKLIAQTISLDIEDEPQVKITPIPRGEFRRIAVELNDGKVKCSLRSQGAIDVRRIAQQFGGGGHTMASGATLAGPLETAQKLIFDEIEKQFVKLDNK